MDMQYSRAIEREIQNGTMVLRPGWVRLNFNYFIDEQEFEYLLRAIELVAEHGWRLLPFYQFDTDSGVWRYQGESTPLVASLCDWRFADLAVATEGESPIPLALEGFCAMAERELLRQSRPGQCYPLTLTETGERLRWFLLPQEAAEQLDRDNRAATG
jgi:hypothetical protein